MKGKGKNYKYIKMLCLVISIVSSCLFLFVGCGKIIRQLKTVNVDEKNKNNEDIKSMKTIDDLSYDNNSKENYIVYIEENNVYEPYLVLTSDYGGNVLLLRKNLMTESRPYKENKTGLWASHEYGSYYEDSSIDEYLNSEFYERLSQSVKDALVESEIEITDKGSYHSMERISINISRKIFLLSLEELGAVGSSSISVKEGKPLKCFEDDYNRRLAYTSSGLESSYWTRTPQLWETFVVYSIASKIGGGSADISNGIRPAFCIKKSTPVVKSTDVVDGETVYIIGCSTFRVHSYILTPI